LTVVVPIDEKKTRVKRIMKKNNPKIWVPILAAIGLGIGILKQKDSNGRNPEHPDTAAPAQPNLNELNHGGPLGPRRLQQSSDDVESEDLINLKRQWSELGVVPPDHHTNEDLKLRNALSKESARRLMCSADAVRLLEFLDENNILNSVEYEIRVILTSDLGAEARQTLILLPDTPSKDGRNYRERWSFNAGKGCPPEEFDSFCAALGSATCVQEAVFGYNVQLVAEEPIAALESALNQIDKGIETSARIGGLTTLLNEMPTNADFEQVAAKIAGLDSKEPLSPFGGIQSALITRWSQVDPYGAAKYIMDEPDKFKPYNINYPVTEVMNRDLNKGIEWIQAFPDGPYFDAAAEIAVLRLRERGNHREAEILASQIGDPSSRKKYLKEAATPFKDHD
jgi:hypothetical protein